MTVAISNQESFIRALLTNSVANETGESYKLDGRYGSVTFQVVGAGWTGKVIFETTIDGETWQPTLAQNTATGVPESEATASGQWRLDTTGVSYVRVTHSNYVAGSVSVHASISALPGTQITASLSVGSISVGAVKIEDGTTTNKLTVSPAGRAATDSNLQLSGVAVSPANPVPVSDGGAALSIDDGGGVLSVDDGGGTLSIDDGGGIITVDGSVMVQGVQNHDDPVSVRPVVSGGVAYTALPIPVANGDVVQLHCDVYGRVAITDGGGSVTVDGTVGTLAQGTEGAASPSNIMQIGGSTSGGILHRVLVDALGRVVVTDGGTPVTVTGVVTSASAAEGTDGAVAPSKVVQIGGATAGSVLQTLRTDSDGSVQVISGAAPLNVTTVSTVTVSGAVTANAPSALVATSTIANVDTSQIVLNANANRLRWMIQNAGIVPVFVKKGAGASSIDYSFILQGGTTTADGQGGFHVDEIYKGVVTAVAASGTGNFVAVCDE